MSWQVGDLAISRGYKTWQSLVTGELCPGPEVDQIVRVEKVAYNAQCGTTLRFKEWPKHEYGAACFRKIKPDEATGSRQDWIDLLKVNTKEFHNV